MDNNDKPEVTTQIVFEGRVKNKSGLSPIKLRVTYQKHQKYYTIKGSHTDINTYKAIYSDKTSLQNKALRKKYDALETKARNIIDKQLEIFSFDSFEKLYLTTKKPKVTLKDYFEEKIELLEDFDKLSTASIYRSSLSSFLEYDQRIEFKKLTPKYLKEYQKWMINNGKSYTTISIYLRSLRHIFNSANRSLMLPSPFKGEDQFSIPTSHNNKRSLNLDEILRLANYTPSNRNELVAQKYWVFSYLCCGMNMSDIARLKFSNLKNSEISFVRFKTRDTKKSKTEIIVPLYDEAVEIINLLSTSDKASDNYIFPILSNHMTEKEIHPVIKQHTKQVNKYLRVISSKIGLDVVVTTYFARHCYSTVLKNKGVPTAYIKEQLGHSSIQTTEIYLGSFEGEQRKKYSKGLLN